MEEQIKKVIAEKIRPALQADGGDIEFVALDGNDVQVRLKGACHGCRQGFVPSTIKAPEVPLDFRAMKALSNAFETWPALDRTTGPVALPQRRALGRACLPA